MVTAISFAICASAAAQTRVRVIRDQVTIWRRDVRIPAAQVNSGTILDVVGREGDWYIVLVPAKSGGAGESGMIAAASVEPLTESPRSEVSQPRPARPPSTSVMAPKRRIEVFGFGDVGLTSWLAHETFAAVLGHSYGPTLGAGVDVRVGRAFVQGAFERFQQTGQRVFVSDGQAFGLGISDTVRVLPVWGSVGYRHDFTSGVAYVGAGGGMYFYKETSDFADGGDDVDERFASYHGLVGVEFGRGHAVRTAIEAQFTTVPNALGTSGASAAFGERNLGGVQLRVKLLVGR